MSICICDAKRRDGSRRCRDLRVEPASGAIDCGRSLDLIAAMRASVIDGVETVADILFDAPTLIREMRARGWRVKAPTTRVEKDRL